MGVPPQVGHGPRGGGSQADHDTGMGHIPSSFVDSAFTVRTGDPGPLEIQGIRHGLEINSNGHRRGHWSSEEEHDYIALTLREYPMFSMSL
jgi:hypothetical protein